MLPLLVASTLSLLASAPPPVPATLAWTVRHMDRDVGRIAFRHKEGKLHTKGKLTVPGSNLTLELDSHSSLTPEGTSGFRWKFWIFGAPRSAKGQIEGGRLRATTSHGEEVAQRTDETRGVPILDLIGFGFWLARQDGEEAPRAAAFAGYFLYDVFAVRKDLEVITLPLGPRKARRWELTATRPGRTRTLTLWTDPSQGIPLKAHVDLDYFGWVDLVLSR